jgi:Ca2+-binding RTX toxin-like protein
LRAASSAKDLVGGAGLDRLTGGAGADAFVFDLAAAKTNLDVITDMSVAEGDKIYLNLTIFKGLGKIAGVLQDDQFFGGNVAVANTHRILYDNTTGNLWYDADGSGKVLAVQIATLDNKPASLTAADFIGYLPAKVGDLSVVITGVQAADSVFLY